MSLALALDSAAYLRFDLPQALRGVKEMRTVTEKRKEREGETHVVEKKERKEKKEEKT